MEIEEAETCTVADGFIDTSVSLKTLSSVCDLSSAGVDTRGRRRKRKRQDQQEYDAAEGNTKGTQTAGHVFVGKQGEVIITTNYFLVKLVFDSDAVHRLTDTAVADVDHITDTIMTSLARLEWNGEGILQNALTSFRLRLTTSDLMPRLLQEVAQLMVVEQDQHRVQRLAQELLEQHLIRLFGMDVSSLVFILHHSSVDDAHTALTSPQRQAALQAVLLGFLPDWVAPVARWTVATYRLTPRDGAENFGFGQCTEVPFAAASMLRGRSEEEPGPGAAIAVSESPAAQPLPRGADAERGSKFSGVLHGAGQRTVDISQSVDDDSLHKDGSRRDEGLTGPEEAEPKPSTSCASPPHVGEEGQSYPPSGDVTAAGVEGQASGAEGETWSGGVPSQHLSGKRLLRLEDIDTDDIPKHDVDLRLVILGKTGSGKSSTANSILGQELFPVGVSFSGITTQCQLLTADRGDTVIEVMDSPGLFDTVLTNEEVSSMVMSAVSSMEDGPDAVLYVLRIGARYTDEEFAVYTLLKALLDENVTQYLIVVFTHGDLLQGRGIESMFGTLETLASVIRESGNRYVVFDNTADDKTPQVNQLLAQVRQLKAQNQGRRYRCPRYAEKLDEIDLELEARLIKAQQESLKGKNYVRSLQAQLSQAQQRLKKDAQHFARQEQARKREEALREESARLTEALQHGQLEEREVRKQVEALRDKMAKADVQFQGETEKLRRQQQQQAEEMRKREEERRRFTERLEAEKRAAERAAAERQAQEMARLRPEIARSRRRRRNDCCLM